MKFKNKMLSSKSLLLGLSILIIIILLTLFADFFSTHDPVEQNPIDRLKPPCSEYLLGTDNFGRDIYSRLLYGGRYTLTASLLALGAALLVGLAVGVVSGFYGGLIDKILMRIVDVLMGFPFTVLAIIITALFGVGFIHLLMAIVMVWWVPFARLSRSIVLNIKDDTDILAAHVLGANSFTIILKEIIPKVISPILILSTFELGNLILSISALSFFGLGSQPPSPEWGAMLADSKAYFFQVPHMLLGPSLAVFLIVMSLNLMGEGLRDELSPYETTEIR